MPRVPPPKRKGQLATTRLTKVMKQQRNLISEWMVANPNWNPIAKLQEIVDTTPKDDVRVAALSLIARHTTPVPMPKEDLACFKLPPMDTPEQIAGVLSGVADAVAQGQLGSKQADALSKVLSLRLDAISQVNLARRLEHLERKLEPPPPGKVRAISVVAHEEAPDPQPPMATGRIVAVAVADPEDI